MATTGRMVVFEGHGTPFRVVERSVPEPEPGAALIQITLASICGSDMHGWRGDNKTTSPIVPRHQGHEGVGRIAALGDGLTTDSDNRPLAVGDRVVFGMFTPCGRCRACLAGKDWLCPDRRREMQKTCDVWPYFRGTFGDYYYAYPSNCLFKVPDKLSDDMLTGVNCAMAQVYNGVEAAGLDLGETVVIQGAGGLGLYAIAVARERGAGRIIVIDGLPDRLETASLFGADEIISLRDLPSPEQRITRVKELTDGWGADVVLEVAGFVQVVEEGIPMLGQGGRYVTIGNIVAGYTYPADPELWVHGNLHIIGNNNYGRRHLKGALDLLARTRGKYPYERIVSHRYPLEQVNEAFADQETGAVTRASLVP